MPTKKTGSTRTKRTTKKVTASTAKIKRVKHKSLVLSSSESPVTQESKEPKVVTPVVQSEVSVSKKSFLHAVGRRKSAVARARLYFDGNPDIIVNTKPYTEYFHNFYLQKIVTDPLRETELLGKVAVSIKVTGGGRRGQADAVRHSIARVLSSWKKELRTPLKQAGFLRRDPRVKERKKYGLKRARRAPQWSKR